MDKISWVSPAKGFGSYCTCTPNLGMHVRPYGPSRMATISSPDRRGRWHSAPYAAAPDKKKLTSPKLSFPLVEPDEVSISGLPQRLKGGLNKRAGAPALTVVEDTLDADQCKMYPHGNGLRRPFIGFCAATQRVVSGQSVAKLGAATCIRPSQAPSCAGVTDQASARFVMHFTPTSASRLSRVER